MKRLLVVLVLGAAGCLPPYTRIVLPHTDEARACWRECEGIANTCRSRWSGDTHCPDQRYNCQRSCPGAIEVTEKE